ncbi:MAG: phenylacetate--CoA ligase [Opitutae bacterium]|nr:phenylacetate--CoA ligase [Opitutae bacterium]|tara:strand:- start:928 stop:2436 length:1509 start_codon:yes stop_codon:yes gene_type:complete
MKRNWDKEPIERQMTRQDEALKKYLSKVVLPNSAYYRNLFQAYGIGLNEVRCMADLQAVPFTSKETLVAALAEPDGIRSFVLEPDAKALARKPSVILKSLLLGKKSVRKSMEREFRPVFMTSTTGRSADPIPFLYSHHDLNNLRKAGGRVIELGDARRKDRILNAFPYAPHLAYWLTHYAALEKNIFCVSTGGGKVMGTAGNLRLIKKTRPSILVGMPTFIYHLLRQAEEDGQMIRGLRRIVLGGEKVVAGTRRKLADLAERLGSPGIRVIATYGFTEAKLAWPECSHDPAKESTGYHVSPDLGIVEIVDPETGWPVPDGHPGEIVFTPLKARGSVVLRYRTGDLTEGGLVRDTCPCCGRTVPRITGKISRVSQHLSVNMEKLKGTLVDFNEIEHFLDDLEGVGSWQLELSKANNDPLDLDELTLRICPESGLDNRSLANEICESFEQAMELRPNRISFVTPEELRKRHGVGDLLKEEKIVDRRQNAVRSTPIEPHLVKADA